MDFFYYMPTGLIWVSIGVLVAGWWISSAIADFTEIYRDTHHLVVEEEEQDDKLRGAAEN